MQGQPLFHSLQEKMQTEPVSRLALREAVLVKPSTTVNEAVATMREKGLGCVIVADEDSGKPLGVFTELRLIDLLLADAGALRRAVGEHLDDRWACVRLTESIARVVEAMHRRNTRFVVVTDEEGRGVALTGQRSICEYVTESFPRGVLTTRIGSRPGFEQREGA